MTNLFYSLLGFVVAVGLLTTVHEFGHFWVARLLGVKVLRFSIGFGKSLLSWHDKHGTEYVLAAIPLGGYVKMLDQNEGAVAANELHKAFNRKPVWMRMLVICAGPAFNLIFAIITYSIVFMWGVATLAPVLGNIHKGTAAYNAGLHPGQEIVAVADQKVHSWEDIAVAMMGHVGDNNFVNVTVLDPHTKKTSVHALNINNLATENNDDNILKNIGLEPIDPMRPIVGKVMADMPAQQAGLEPGDEIISIDSRAVQSQSDVVDLLSDKYDRAVHMRIKRHNEELPILITPQKKVLEGGELSGFIGIQFQTQPVPENLIRLERFGPWTAFCMALYKTKEYSVLTLQFLGKMITGKMSLQYVAGPISIAKFAGISVQSGMEYFLGFLALVSISLGVLNLLPIPILDGGHLLFCCIELVRGKALSMRAMQVGHVFGFVVLGCFMLLAMYNDVVRLLQ